MSDLAAAWTKLETAAQGARERPIAGLFDAEPDRLARLNREADLFNADVWVGAQAVALGLADGVAHAVPKLKQLYGDKVRLVPMTRRRSLMQRLSGGAAAEALSVLEDRAAFARFGL